MTGLSDLAASERGVFSVGVLVLVTVLVVLGKLTGDQWIDLVKFVSGALIVSKGVTTAVRTYTGKQAEAPGKQAEVPTAKIVSEGETQ